MLWQIVEKEDIGTDWHLVRYPEKYIKKYESKEDALQSALNYLTDINCDNALAAAEKRSSVEAFMETDEGILLGKLDGKMWYLTYQKDTPDPEDKSVIHAKGENIHDKTYFELRDKIEVSVRPIPGT